MQLIRKSSIVILYLFSLFFISCGGDSKNNNDPVNDSINKMAAANDTYNNSAVAFALPAPLQIATVLKNSNASFSEKLLVPSKKKRTFSSDYSRAINLGIYTTDLGYTTLFGQRQSTLNYYK